VRGTLFARLHQDSESLVVRMDREERDYPWVLVPLSRVHPDALRDLLSMARRSAAAKRQHSSKASEPRP
jgi:hypothetical protein